MLLPDGDEVEAIAPSHVPLMDFFGNCPHAPHAWHWSITQIVEHSLPASHDGFANLIGTSGNVAAGTHMPQHKRSALKESFGLRLLRQCERFVRFALYCQINWISLAVVGGCTALFMVGAILAYDPSRGFLARRGEPGGGT
jgi:hypothetical protein